MSDYTPDLSNYYKIMSNCYTYNAVVDLLTQLLMTLSKIAIIFIIVICSIGGRR